MKVLSSDEAQTDLEAVMERVANDHAPVLVTRQGGESVVMISLADWRHMDETDYLLSNPVNAKRLMDSIAELDAGRGIVRDLIEP